MIDLAIYATTLAAFEGVPVYPFCRPIEDEYPAVFYSPVIDVPNHAHEGRTPYRVASYQFDLYSETLEEVESLTERLRAKWEATEGEVEGVEILVAHVTACAIECEPDDAGDLYHSRLSVSVEYLG